MSLQGRRYLLHSPTDEEDEIARAGFPPTT